MRCNFEVNIKKQKKMVKINDLRIGNYIYNQDNILKVVSFQVLHAMYNGIGIYNNIILNKEWFIKLGFDCDRDGYSIGHPFRGDDHIGIYKHKNGTLSYTNGGFSPKLEYVHQLQNLYYCLTGKELECVANGS
jgi:hypothetical protein